MLMSVNSPSEYIVEAVDCDCGPRQVGEREGGEVVRYRLQLEHHILGPRRQQTRVAGPEKLGHASETIPHMQLAE